MRFDHGHDLGGLSVMKTWGLASLGGYIAACVTIHPGDMVEYTTQSRERSTIVFGEIDNRERPFPWERVTEHAISEAEAQVRILDTILAEGQYQREKDQSILTSRIIYAAVCASMQLRDAVTSERLEGAQKALQGLESVTGLVFQPEIACIERLLTMQDADLDMQDAESRSFPQYISTDQFLNIPVASRVHETCSICGESIGWDSLDAAHCTRNHAFGMSLSSLMTSTSKEAYLIAVVRCALTFLTIQEPGISKYCESCDREYFDEQVLLASVKHIDGAPGVESQGRSVGDAEEESTGINVEETHDIGPGMLRENDYERESLAHVLFSMYDVCVYCGGKFMC